MTYICGVEDKIGVTLLFFFPTAEDYSLDESMLDELGYAGIDYNDGWNQSTRTGFFATTCKHIPVTNCQA